MTTEELLNKLQIPFRRVNHPAVFTVSEANIHVADENPVKNLFLKDKSGNYYLVIMSGDKRLDLKSLEQQIKSDKLSFARPERLMEILGVTPGSVSLFGLLNDNQNVVKLVIEKHITQVNELGFHPNDNTATIFFNPQHLNKIVNELNHEMHVIDL